MATFLREAAGRPFAWGSRDCGLWLADWVFLRCGYDPAADLRGRYTDAEGAYALLPDGLLGMVRELALGAGMHGTDTPAAGDIGVICIRDGEPTGAVKVEKGWVVLAAKCGISRVPDRAVEVRGAWTFDA